mmetsp:Transcript_32867/g.63269  ORF Transcript_32867/g.63269 Transcript_32867/m.63269 type:complete len:312 (-) Transcript_32867:16-951(-)
MPSLTCSTESSTTTMVGAAASKVTLASLAASLLLLLKCTSSQLLNCVGMMIVPLSLQLAGSTTGLAALAVLELPEAVSELIMTVLFAEFFSDLSNESVSERVAALVLSKSRVVLLVSKVRAAPMAERSLRSGGPPRLLACLALFVAHTKALNGIECTVVTSSREIPRRVPCEPFLLIVLLMPGEAKEFLCSIPLASWAGPSALNSTAKSSPLASASLRAAVSLRPAVLFALTTTRFVNRCTGIELSSLAPSSSALKSIGPRISCKIRAAASCCLSEHLTSSERMRGASETVKASSLMAATTRRSFSRVTSV